MADLSPTAVLLRAYQAAKHYQQFSFTATKAAKGFVNECGFGKVVGRQWLLEPADLPRIRDYLVNFLGIHDPEHASTNFSKLDRITVATVIPQEKFAGKGPHEGMVLVRGAGGNTKVNGLIIPAVGSSCTYLLANDVISIEHDCLIVVENFQAVTHFVRLVLHDFPYSDPLLMFRGDAMYPMNGAKALAEKNLLPVIAFCDLDPKGCHIANNIPNRIGAIFPVEYTALRRADLFEKQRTFVTSLNRLPTGWTKPVTAMRENGMGITQEEMIAQEIPCVFFPTLD